MKMPMLFTIFDKSPLQLTCGQQETISVTLLCLFLPLFFISMAEYKPCSNPQCKEHHIRHPTCKKPDCSICSTKNGPILCDEMIMTTGEIIPLTQRERDIDSILRYFLHQLWTRSIGCTQPHTYYY